MKAAKFLVKVPALGEGAGVETLGATDGEAVGEPVVVIEGAAVVCPIGAAVVGVRPEGARFGAGVFLSPLLSFLSSPLFPPTPSLRISPNLRRYRFAVEPLGIDLACAKNDWHIKSNIAMFSSILIVFFVV